MVHVKRGDVVMVNWTDENGSGTYPALILKADIENDVFACK